MPGYGVPADPDGILPWSFAHQKLDASWTF
jgi:hypothetical protein